MVTPNELYFQNVDAVMQAARERNLIISTTLYHQRYRKFITLDNARAWAKWLAQRYKAMPNILWSMTPEAKPEFVPILRELAAGLRDGDGGAHLITFKPDPAPYSSSFIHGESWLDFDSMQTWKSVELIYPMVTKDYNLKPVKPVLMNPNLLGHSLGVRVNADEVVALVVRWRFVGKDVPPHQMADDQILGSE